MSHKFVLCCIAVECVPLPGYFPLSMFYCPVKMCHHWLPSALCTAVSFGVKRVWYKTLNEAKLYHLGELIKTIIWPWVLPKHYTNNICHAANSMARSPLCPLPLHRILSLIISHEHSLTAEPPWHCQHVCASAVYPLAPLSLSWSPNPHSPEQR